MSTKARRWAAMVFAGLAIVAGGLQLLAYVKTDASRHLVVGIVAVAIGLCVLVAIKRAPGEGGDPQP